MYRKTSNISRTPTFEFRVRPVNVNNHVQFVNPIIVEDAFVFLPPTLKELIGYIMEVDVNISSCIDGLVRFNSIEILKNIC